EPMRARRAPAVAAATTPSARTRRSPTSRRWPFSGGPGDERAWTQHLAAPPRARARGGAQRGPASERAVAPDRHRRAHGFLPRDAELLRVARVGLVRDEVVEHEERHVRVEIAAQERPEQGRRLALALL